MLTYDSLFFSELHRSIISHNYAIEALHFFLLSSIIQPFNLQKMHNGYYLCNKETKAAMALFKSRLKSD